MKKIFAAIVVALIALTSCVRNGENKYPQTVEEAEWENLMTELEVFHDWKNGELPDTLTIYLENIVTDFEVDGRAYIYYDDVDAFDFPAHEGYPGWACVDPAFTMEIDTEFAENVMDVAFFEDYYALTVARTEGVWSIVEKFAYEY